MTLTTDLMSSWIFSRGFPRPEWADAGSTGSAGPAKPWYRYRRLHALMEQRDHPASVVRIYRLYRAEGRRVRRLRRKRLLRVAAVSRAVENGPELTGRHCLSGARERKIPLIHSQPGRPMQNGHVENFKGRLRDECVNGT